MKIGDRVFLTGGYDTKPEWLSGGTGYHGSIEKFIPGQNDTLAAVVRFEQPVVTSGLTANYAVLELRYEGNYLDQFTGDRSCGTVRLRSG